MSVEFNSVSDRSIGNTGNKSQVASADASQQRASATGNSSSADDQVSLTSSATQLKALENQVAQLPVVDVQRVSNVQRSVATGSFSFEPVEAADNLLTQERELALLEAAK
mgnify:FL=1